MKGIGLVRTKLLSVSQGVETQLNLQGNYPSLRGALESKLRTMA